MSVSAEELETLALRAIRSQIDSPGWADTIVKHALMTVEPESRTGAMTQSGPEIAEVDRRIQNVVTAIERVGASDALAESLRELECQRKTLLRRNVIEQRPESTSNVELANRITALGANFDELWRQGSLDERKTLLRDFIQQVTVGQVADGVQAEFCVWTVPSLQNEMPLAHLVGEGQGHLLPLKSIAGARIALNMPGPPSHLLTVKSYKLSGSLRTRLARRVA
jgi:hypothetical protein